MMDSSSLICFDLSDDAIILLIHCSELNTYILIPISVLTPLKITAQNQVTRTIQLWS